MQQPKEGEPPPIVCQIGSGGMKQCIVTDQEENNIVVKPSSEKFSETVKPGTPRVQSTVDTETIVTFKPAVDKSVCSHLNQIRPVVPSARGCEECLATGETWVHLRLCLTCGHVGCCDSSKNKHATAHFAETNHPLIKSLEKGEEWGWCYQDRI